MQNVRQFSLFSTPSLQMSDKPFSPFAFCFPPYLYMGRYAPKEGKIKEKVTKYFSETLFCVVQLAKWCFFVFFFLTYARACAPSNSDVDFLLSQVSHKGEIWREKPSKFWRAEEREKRLLVEFSAYFQSLKFVFVKICLEIRRNGLNYSVLPIVLWHLWQQKCKNSCDARIRVRAREGCYRCFHNSNAMFPISVSRIGVFALPTFHWKQHVVFTKTTRRFPQNNTSFSPKQHVVFPKTTRHLKRKKDLFCGELGLKIS